MKKQGLPCFLSTAAMLMTMVSCDRGEIDNPGPKYGTAPADGSRHTYSFVVHPLHNPAKLIAAYQPLMDYLNDQLKNAHLQVEASRDYAAFEVKYQNRNPDFLLPNPWQTLQAMKSGYHVIAIAGNPADFKGIFIVRKNNSDIRQPSDLKGKAVSYPAPTALAACIMPHYFLYQNGIDVNHDIENRYVGSQESAIMNVYMGKTAAGATWPPPWRAFQREHPQEAAELKVQWETEPLINNSVMARDDVPTELREQVQRLLVNLHDTEMGKTILAGMETERFYQADDRDYDVAQAYVTRFEKEVRKVEEK
jgi:phosphonate transport system substrate-binding protein